jgi:murein L,D-transpeptidase YafK
MMSFRRSGVLLLALSGLVASCGRARSPQPTRTKAAHGRSSVASRHGFHGDSVGLAAVLGAHKAILVDKSEKTLTLFKDGTPRKTYPIAIGKAEDGPKMRAGDWKTPEGLYYVAAHHPGSRFYKALKISYPNVRDARRGVAAGLISPEDAAEIAGAIEAGDLPPQDTKLGYNIEIHGGYHLVPGQPDQIRSYTRGCMALTNTMIDQIYAWADDGTPVLIQP